MEELDRLIGDRLKLLVPADCGETGEPGSEPRRVGICTVGSGGAPIRSKRADQPPWGVMGEGSMSGSEFVLLPYVGDDTGDVSSAGR